ncbi:MAG: bifunctional hydroxymethylpyrimidine kinase/phosphomethylpyrimidine kinase [Pyrinomonadaceae bacterium]|nr:bifunctional hydroxymethylpyrimidine kinase/phosphomethylpyrimidine kinase [Pyrinomonadaceae bacterium]
MQNNQVKTPPVVLTIAGVDPSGGAGIYADVKTFSRFGCYAAAAITSITFQNTTGVFGAIHQTAEILRRQIEPILNDFNVLAVKTGMLPTREIIEETARIITEFKLKNIVVDPVIRSTSGFDVIDEEALRALIEQLFPLSEIITPNLPEAERIVKFNIESDNDFEKAAKIMFDYGAKNVLIKGGHRSIAVSNENKIARDILFDENGNYTNFEAAWIDTNSTHGTGCVLSSAIAANLARGENLIDSIKRAKTFVNDAIKTAPILGNGHSPINLLDF